jgi:hypothetical protein
MKNIHGICSFEIDFKSFAFVMFNQGVNDLCNFTDLLLLLLLILQFNGDDSLFMEANTLAFVFSKVADSFTQLNCKYFSSKQRAYFLHIVKYATVRTVFQDSCFC